MAIVEMDVAPTWDRVTALVGEVRRFFLAAGATAEAAEGLAMIATELCENAIKYGDTGKSPIHLRLIAIGRELTIEVTNSTDPKMRNHQRRLSEMLRWMQGFKDPFAAYVQRLRLVAKQGLESADSGLGLVRVAAEGKAVLHFMIDQNDRLTVTAVRREQ